MNAPRLRKPGAPDEDLDETMISMFAAEHEKSLKENQPDTHRAMQTKGTLAEHCQSVGRTAARAYRDFMEPVEQETNQAKGYEAKLAAMSAGEMEARGRVMREIVLVPDLETQQAAQRGGYR
jgi:hypothetical protein